MINNKNNFAQQQFSVAWMTGSTVAYQPTVYGTKGVPNAANTPGARDFVRLWTDASGNIWLFGGAQVDIHSSWHWYNDLWKYNPSTNMWTWVSGTQNDMDAGVYGTKGVASPSNIMSSRFGYAQWTDGAGNFWFFGGNNGLPGYLNDMWKYDPVANVWTWMNGSSTNGSSGTFGTKGVANAANSPSGRGDYFPPAYWKDSSGNFWIFGGGGLDSTGTQGAMSDTWMYNPTSNMWTWMTGPNTALVSPVYGAQGITSPNSTPGSLGGSAAWTDGLGGVWIYGGGGYDSGYRGGNGYFGTSALWKFNMTTLRWTWIAGPTTTVYSNGGADSVYGELGVEGPLNTPGSKTGCAWTDSNGLLWMGAGGYDNALWRLDPTTAQWAWMAGTDHTTQAAVSGVQGLPSTGNLWGSNVGAAGCTQDASDHFWIFGGSGYDSAGTNGPLNALWKFSP